MSRRLQLVFFFVGAGLFVWLVGHMGPGRLRSDAASTGWMLVPIVLLYGAVHACNAQTLRLIMADDPGRPTYGRTFAIIVAGSALNFVTPIVNAGGEPYRVAALAPELGAGRATGAVILHTMLRAMPSLLVWLTALFLGLALLPRTHLTTALILLAIFLVSMLLWLVFGGHRRGVLERLLDLLRATPGLARLATKLEPKRPALAVADAQIVAFYHRHPRRFAQALGLECLSRCLFMLEFCLIGASIGTHVGYDRAFLIGGLEALVTNLLFFVPFDLGTRETSTSLLFQQLGYHPGIGVYAALVGRVRDILWIAAGLALIWAAGRHPSPSVGATEGAPS